MENGKNILHDLKRFGLRLTKTRRTCVDVLSSAKTPLSAAQLSVELEKRGVIVNKTTIYRELERLERIGVVENVQLNDRKRHYELAFENHHHHLICMQCENVEDVDVSEQELREEEAKVGRLKKFTIVRHSLEFFGLCEHCALN